MIARHRIAPFSQAPPRSLPTMIDEMLAAHPSAVRPAHAVAGLALMMLYGGAMGSFGLWGGGNSADGWLQVLYSSLKVPLLLGATFALSLPSFFVFNALAGVAGDFKDVIRTLIATQSALAVLLGSFAPLSLLWYASNGDYLSAVLLNVVAFGVASVGVLPLVRRNYRKLIQRNPTHRRMVVLWGMLYSFIGIQMGWVLRPFIGDPDRSAEFFRSNGWGNAYMVIVDIVMKVVTLGDAY